MAGAGTGERDEPFGVTAAEARRRRVVARAGLRLVPEPDLNAALEGGQSKEQARLLGAYNLYNG